MLNIKTNSKLVKPGDTFIAIKGLSRDGHDYIEDAIKNGATSIICEHGSYNVETVVVDDTSKFLREYLYTNYYDKIKNMHLIGMTGTNGKTTTCYLIYQALRKIGKKCGYIGTIGFYIDGKVGELDNTTPEIQDMYDMLLTCCEQNCEYVVMEVSSHALALGRVDTLMFDYAIFSNLTEDHLDFHKTFDEYISAKNKLFNMVKKDGAAIINVDDESYEKMLNNNNRNILFGFNDSDYKVLDYRYENYKTIFNVNINGKSEEIVTKLLGKYNIHNMMSVIIILLELKVDLNEIKNIVSTLEFPPGRLDTLSYKDSLVIVDYAHTPDAIYNVVSCVREYTEGKIYTIVGCGGNRDKTKRPIMAKIATDLSDYAIITSDNPRFENPSDIIKDMLEGLDNTNYEVIEDRVSAIQKGIDLLEKKDVLLILGKGHEDYQIINGVKHHHDDKECAIEYMNRVI